MVEADVVRAWKDPIYRASLNAETLARIPSNPAGTVELSDDQLKAAAGFDDIIVPTFRTCTEYTFRRYHCC